MCRRRERGQLGGASGGRRLVGGSLRSLVGAVAGTVHDDLVAGVDQAVQERHRDLVPAGTSAEMRKQLKCSAEIVKPRAENRSSVTLRMRAPGARATAAVEGSSPSRSRSVRAGDASGSPRSRARIHRPHPPGGPDSRLGEVSPRTPKGAPGVAPSHAAGPDYGRRRLEPPRPSAAARTTVRSAVVRCPSGRRATRP